MILDYIVSMIGMNFVLMGLYFFLIKFTNYMKLFSTFLYHILKTYIQIHILKFYNMCTYYKRTYLYFHNSMCNNIHCTMTRSAHWYFQMP